METIAHPRVPVLRTDMRHSSNRNGGGRRKSAEAAPRSEIPDCRLFELLRYPSSRGPACHSRKMSHLKDAATDRGTLTWSFPHHVVDGEKEERLAAVAGPAGACEHVRLSGFFSWVFSAFKLTSGSGIEEMRIRSKNGWEKESYREGWMHN